MLNILRHHGGARFGVWQRLALLSSLLGLVDGCGDSSSKNRADPAGTEGDGSVQDAALNDCTEDFIGLQAQVDDAENQASTAARCSSDDECVRIDIPFRCLGSCGSVVVPVSQRDQVKLKLGAAAEECHVLADEKHCQLPPPSLCDAAITPFCDDGVCRLR